ncbi:Putative uncharacterized protein [Bifidobacterium animalis subsp. animalis IM386]|uniref:Uncharacterized protein n=1 Tax=Bifidobacterium animalis subsp. animalis IM386 TaxID=1402194 RepID=A0AAV2W383_9BIFI|nr:Putative uncharacterized protein [Bifidobacterium animalis subsp. animalis IM386]
MCFVFMVQSGIRHDQYEWGRIAEQNENRSGEQPSEGHRTRNEPVPACEIPIRFGDGHVYDQHEDQEHDIDPPALTPYQGACDNQIDERHDGRAPMKTDGAPTESESRPRVGLPHPASQRESPVCLPFIHDSPLRPSYQVRPLPPAHLVAAVHYADACTAL